MKPLWEAGGVPWLVPRGGSYHPGASQVPPGLCCPLWIQLEITQAPPEDSGSASALEKTGSFPSKSLLFFALDLQILLCPGRSIFNTITSFDEFLKGLKVTSGTSQLLFQFPDHLAASWIYFQYIPVFLSALRKD